MTEVLVALTVLSMGIVGVVGAFCHCQRAATGNLRFDEAAAIAQRELQLAMAKSLNNTSDIKGTSGLHSWTVTFQEKALGLIQASVVVRWPLSGRMQEYRLSEIFQPRTEQT